MRGKFREYLGEQNSENDHDAISNPPYHRSERGLMGGSRRWILTNVLGVLVSQKGRSQCPQKNAANPTEEKGGAEANEPNTRKVENHLEVLV